MQTFWKIECYFIGQKESHEIQLQKITWNKLKDSPKPYSKEILVSPQVWSSFRIAIANWQIILRNTYCYGYSVSHVYFAVRSVYVGKTGFYVGKMN